jgi:acyl dehydratase
MRAEKLRRSIGMEYGDIAVGTKIPPLMKKVTIVQTAMYCGITWDFARQHYDREMAQSLGYERPVVDPQMYGAFLARMLTEWISIKARIKRLTLRYMAPSRIGDILHYTGKVVKKYEKEGQRYLDCDLLVENQNGDQIVKGSAVILFFSSRKI